MTDDCHNDRSVWRLPHESEPLSAPACLTNGYLIEGVSLKTNGYLIEGYL